MPDGMEARFPIGELSSGLSLQRLGPNLRQPFGHKHEEQEELYVVLDGSARLALDDEVVELKKWDAMRIEPQVTRCLEGGPMGSRSWPSTRPRHPAASRCCRVGGPTERLDQGRERPERKRAPRRGPLVPKGRTASAIPPLARRSFKSHKCPTRPHLA